MTHVGTAAFGCPARAEAGLLLGITQGGGMPGEHFPEIHKPFVTSDLAFHN
jgi:hypothetical protein